MAKGTQLTQEVKALITKIYLEHPDYGPKKIREKLLEGMKKTGLDKYFEPGWPGEGAVGKLVREIRKRRTELGPDPKDSPWSMVRLADYDIPPEALHVVLKAWAKALTEDNPLTIREALWVARLYHLFKEGKEWEQLKKNNPFIDDKIRALDFSIFINRARIYAKDERTLELMERPVMPFTERSITSYLWFNDAIFYLQMMGDDSPLRKCMESMNWRKVIPEEVPEELRELLPAYYQSKEAQNERSHNQEIQE